MQTISNHTSNKDLLKTVDFFGRPAPPPPVHIGAIFAEFATQRFACSPTTCIFSKCADALLRHGRLRSNLFCEMVASAPLMLSYRQEDFGYTVCNYSGFNISSFLGGLPYRILNHSPPKVETTIEPMGKPHLDPPNPTK